MNTEYTRRIVSSISPLITLDREQKIRFVNEPFESEFGMKATDLAGRSLLEVLPLSFADRETLLDVLNRRQKKPFNREFRFRRRIYGYTVFSVGDDTGIILKNITEIRRLERKVQSLHSRLLGAQEEERQRVAAELHDGVGQTIVAAKINLMAYSSNPSRNQERFQLGLRLIDQASDELREIYSNLYPSALRELGLASAIRERLKTLETAGLRTQATILLERRLPGTLEVQVYRIVQELIANTLKHAAARAFTLTLETIQDRVHLVATDDGTGFLTGEDGTRKRRGFGLQNIRRRVEDWKGHMQIISYPGGGTSIEIRIPLRSLKEKAK